MTKRLYSYLEKEFRYCNNKKYHKYFEEWVINLTENQIYYYEKLWLK